jgi:hypothetical protein
MINVIQKYRVHILIWVGMFFYLAIAPHLYVQFVLTNGKPVQFNEELPYSSSANLSAWVDSLNMDISKGKNVYNLAGWAFIRGVEDQASFDRFITLKSDTHTYFFPVASTRRPDLGKIFNSLRDSGFSSLIAKEVLPVGTYHIGIVFKHKSQDVIYYASEITDKLIIRTANHLWLEEVVSQP